jgi:predicted Ser/Thr protein kinase
MEFVEGQRLLSYLHSEPDAANCRRTLALVLRQLRALDARSIQKGELVRPDRHILVRSDRTPVLLDFERCRAGHARPANVSQFGQFLGGRKLADALAAGGKGPSPDPERLRAAGAAYVGGGMRQEDFEALLRLVCGAEGGP